jgi:cytidine deaminase
MAVDLPPVDRELVARLAAAAQRAAANAYAPYSRFPVGAACCGASGTIHVGVNVENASYGLTSCAERNAIFSAIGAGESDLRALVLYTPTPSPVTPCGACRQVLCEFGDDIVVVCRCDGPETLKFTSGTLLPARFTLNKGRKTS